mmetsp:Transcript_20144/g.43443  ORF Transcript_20144/g.43443 Transcript_20144/m.43443 type:complete len:242 (-) Transcript_20144:462-1187(-)
MSFYHVPIGSRKKQTNKQKGTNFILLVALVLYISLFNQRRRHVCHGLRNGRVLHTQHLDRAFRIVHGEQIPKGTHRLFAGFFVHFLRRNIVRVTHGRFQMLRQIRQALRFGRQAKSQALGVILFHGIYVGLRHVSHVRQGKAHAGKDFGFARQDANAKANAIPCHFGGQGRSHNVARQHRGQGVAGFFFFIVLPRGLFGDNLALLVRIEIGQRLVAPATFVHQLGIVGLVFQIHEKRSVVG